MVHTKTYQGIYLTIFTNIFLSYLLWSPVPRVWGQLAPRLLSKSQRKYFSPLRAWHASRYYMLRVLLVVGARRSVLS